ncbi:hypothetical protein SCO12_05615 [Legionella pneumophila serogroup 10]
MKRWDFAAMMSAGRKLFASIHRKKHLANPNHDVHVRHEVASVSCLLEETICVTR